MLLVELSGTLGGLRSLFSSPAFPSHDSQSSAQIPPSALLRVFEGWPAPCGLLASPLLWCLRYPTSFFKCFLGHGFERILKVNKAEEAEGLCVHPPFCNFTIQCYFLRHNFIAETEKVSVVQPWKKWACDQICFPQFPRKYGTNKETADPEGSDELSTILKPDSPVLPNAAWCCYVLSPSAEAISHLIC